MRHYAGEYPHILSGGEQQRVALARAIAPRPSVLLMDEPFSGLDPRLREQMREETLAILHETRATSIVVTHDAEEAMRMGDRVALMRKGRVVQTGKALDLYRAPKDILAARTFSDLNEIAARIEQGKRRDPARPLRRQRLARRRRRHRLRAPARRAAARRRGRACRGACSMRASSATSRLVEVAVQGLDAPLLARVARERRAAARRRRSASASNRRGAGFRGRERRAAGLLNAKNSLACDRPPFAAIVFGEKPERVEALDRLRRDGDLQWD